ncbi:EAL domain-containing protein [Achromobacter xylosoxidans]
MEKADLTPKGSGALLGSSDIIAFSTSATWLSELAGTLTSLGITKATFVNSIDEMEALIPKLAPDVIVSDLNCDYDISFMLPILARKMRQRGEIKKLPHFLWCASTSTHGPGRCNHQLFRNNSGGNIASTETAAIPSHALDAHVRLARQAGIQVMIIEETGPSQLAEAISSLAQLDSPSSDPSPEKSEIPLEEDLIAAISGEHGLRVVLQPQFDLHTRQIIGAEALARWTHPILGNIPPAVFIPMVNRLDMNLMLFSFVNSKVIEILAALTARGIHIPVAVNASVRTVSTQGFSRLLANRMRGAGLPTHLLKIELTEEVPVEDHLLLSASLHSLRALGFPISLDDFGSGSATMNLLATMPFDEVKIDGSFIKGIDQISQSCSIIATISSLARLLNLSLVAEGIEDESSVTTLRRLGCQRGQGFHLSRPLEAKEFLKQIDALCSGNAQKLGEKSSPELLTEVRSPGPPPLPLDGCR